MPDTGIHETRWKRFARSLTFEVRLFLLLLAVTLVLLLTVGLAVSWAMEDLLYEQIGLRAEVQAKQISSDPELVAAVQTRNLPEIAAVASRLETATDADFIVIGDKNTKHLYHPDPKVKPGSQMQGGDNAEVLEGRTSVTLRRGTLGVSLRSKAPIRSQAGDIIGIVSVGYLQKEIFESHSSHRGQIVLFLVALMVGLFWSAWRFSLHIKRQMLGLEPVDISRLVQQQEAVFESIHEGVVAIGESGRVTAINRAAREILGDIRPHSQIVGEFFSELVGLPGFGLADSAPMEAKDEIYFFRGVQVIANIVPVRINDILQGWVISFRRKDEISTLSMQLSQIQRYVDNLRVLRHEHMNWVATISGLLQMRHYDEALRLAKMQSVTQQQVLDYISGAFLDPRICGLLIGKYYRAKELGLELAFDSGCRLNRLPDVLAEAEWMSILGNLLDNAFDAALTEGAQGNKVTLYMAETEKELIIEVADNGCGIDESVRGRIFERGVSSKGKTAGERGIGLYLVKTYVEQAGGVITVDDNEPCGTVFSVFIPKGVNRANV
ncbi:ATP-binding protein [Formivibrio citricus]|nr:sensor histidine kinase [Formivibrio citricus]